MFKTNNQDDYEELYNKIRSLKNNEFLLDQRRESKLNKLFTATPSDLK